MDHDTLVRTLSQPLHDVDPDTLHRALISHRVCQPPAPCGSAVDEWIDSWPVDAVAAVQRFMAAG